MIEILSKPKYSKIVEKIYADNQEKIFESGEYFFLNNVILKSSPENAKIIYQIAWKMAKDIEKIEFCC